MLSIFSSAVLGKAAFLLMLPSASSETGRNLQPNCQPCAVRAKNEYSQSANRRKCFIKTEPEGVKGKQALFTRRQQHPLGTAPRRRKRARRYGCGRREPPVQMWSARELEALFLSSSCPLGSRQGSPRSFGDPGGRPLPPMLQGGGPRGKRPGADGLPEAFPLLGGRRPFWLLESRLGPS